MVLQSAYAPCGTDSAYGATERKALLEHWSKRRLRLYQVLPTPCGVPAYALAMRCPVSAYALAMRCPVSAYALAMRCP
eukprot:2511283-Rhodomonas_salina.1